MDMCLMDVCLMDMCLMDMCLMDRRRLSPAERVARTLSPPGILSPSLTPFNIASGLRAP
jgi:hypothetical protein